MARQNQIEILIRADDQASTVVDGLAKRLTSSFTDLGKTMATAGAGMTLAVAPLAAGFTGAISAASGFEQQLVNIQAITGSTNAEMQAITNSLLTFGASSVAGPQAVAAAFEEIAGGVADSSTHMAILEAAIKTAEAGQADLGATTSALVSTMNAYGFAAEDAAFVSDVLTQTVGMGVGSMEEFAGAFPQVTGLASSLGIGLDSVGASMAYMTTQGFSASQSATQLRAMMVALLNPNAQMATSLQEIGYASGTAAIEQLGLAGAYQLLTSESGTFQDNMAASVGSVEALTGVTALATDEFSEFEETFIAGAEGMTDAARAIQLDSFQAQVDLLKSGIETLRIEIGLALLPTLTRMARMIQPVVTSIISWVRENPQLVTTIAAVTAGVMALGSGLAIAGAALAFVGGGLALLLSPLGLIIAAVSALAFAFETNFLGIRDFATQLTGTLPGIFDLLGNIFGGLKDRIEGAINSLSGFDFSGLWGALSSAFTAALETATSLDLSKVGSFISDNLLQVIKVALPIVFGGGLAGVAVGAVVMAFQKDFLGFRSKLEESGVLGEIENGLDAIANTIMGFFGGGAAGTKGGVKALFDTSTFSAIAGDLNSSLAPLLDTINELAEPIKTGLSDLLDGIKGFFTAFEGTETGNIQEVLGQLAAGLMKIVGVVATVASETIGATLSALGDFLPQLGSGISSLVTGLDRLLGGDYQGALEALGSGIGTIVKALVEFKADVFSGFVNAILSLSGSDLATIAEGVKNIGANILTGIVNGFAEFKEDPLTWLNANLITPLATAITDAAGTALSSGKEIATNILTGILEPFLTIGEWVVTNIINPLIEVIKGQATPMLEAAKPIGTAIVDGIKAGIDSVWSSLKADFEGKVNGLLNSAKNALGISSPSRVFMAVGEDIVSGLNLGLQGSPILNGGTLRPQINVPPSVMNTSNRGTTWNNATFIIPNATNPQEFLRILESEMRRRNSGRLLIPQGSR